MENDTEVGIRVEGRVGRIHLNRPTALNCLNNRMVRAIATGMDAFEASDRILAVVVTAEGERAFCAGGDLKEIYSLAQQDIPLALRTWNEEYALNARIASFRKPWISLIDGICMGAGVAMAIHGTHVVVTENARLSMPEVRVGFYPDVGVSFRLARLRGRLGYWMGMTGEPVNAGEAVALGLAHAIIPRARHGEFIAALGRGCVPEQAMADFALPASGDTLAERERFSESVFSTSDWDESRARLAADPSGEAALARGIMARCSPASLTIAFNAIATAERCPSVAACLARDMQLNAAILARHDFFEGVRTVLYARGVEPVWKDDPRDAWCEGGARREGDTWPDDDDGMP